MKNEVKDLNRERYLSDLGVVLATPEGRRFAWHTLASCGVFKLSYSADSLYTAFAEGKRDIGLRILADILEVAPESYIEMMKVSKKEFENLGG